MAGELPAVAPPKPELGMPIEAPHFGAYAEPLFDDLHPPITDSCVDLCFTSIFFLLAPGIATVRNVRIEPGYVLIGDDRLFACRLLRRGACPTRAASDSSFTAALRTGVAGCAAAGAGLCWPVCSGYSARNPCRNARTLPASPAENAPSNKRCRTIPE